MRYVYQIVDKISVIYSISVMNMKYQYVIINIFVFTVLVNRIWLGH